GEEGRSLFPAEGISPNDLVMWNFWGAATPRLVLDDALYHRIDSNDIPPGFASVPVIIDDQGDEYEAIMVAGSVGIRVISSGEPVTPMREWRHIGLTNPEEGPLVGLDTAQPESGWWIFEKKGENKREVHKISTYCMEGEEEDNGGKCVRPADSSAALPY